MLEIPFRKKLTERQWLADSLVCVGLDPLVEKLPAVVLAACTSERDALLLWMLRIIDTTAEFASMFKFQHAHWEAIPGGTNVLRALIAYIHSHYSDIPVFIDCKRGDIDRTQRQYRETHFTLEGADGMNYNGYMGRDTLKSLIDLKHPGRALVGLGRTSNPDAWEIQDAKMADGRCFWEFMTEHLLVWSQELGVVDNAGVVMGAAHKHPTEEGQISSAHLTRAREIVGEMLWFLIPGIGTQGGFVEETIRAAFRGPGSVAINSSSAITFASAEKDFAEAAAHEAMKLRDQIRKTVAACQ